MPQEQNNIKENIEAVLSLLASVALVPIGCVAILGVLAVVYFLQYGLLICLVAYPLLLVIIFVKENFYDNRRKK